jgi:hypothetical protein
MINAFGHIKIDRKILKWEWYSDSKMVHLFIHFLLSANHKDTKYQGVELKRGQLIIGRLKLATTVGLSENQIRACLNRLKKTGEITIKTTNKFSIVTICKYDTYQSYKENNNQQEYQPITTETTNKPPTNHQQPTTDNNAFNNDNNDNKTNTAFAEKLFDFEEILNPDSFPTWRDECRKFLGNEYFKQNYCKEYKLPMGNLEKIMKDFIKEKNLNNDFKNAAALKVHFGYWYKKHKTNGNTKGASKAFIDVPEDYNYDEMEVW